MSPDTRLSVVQHTGSVEALHAIPMPTDGPASLWVMEPTGPAVAMGSAQRAERFDRARLDRDMVGLASRRSGGGAVFIEPSSTVWVDLVAPRDSRWYDADLAENFLLVGRVWQRALDSLGVATDLCTTSGGRTDASALACWAGLGFGELTVGLAKVVGLSQRRTRWGSRVQAMAVLDHSSARVADYFGPEDRAVLDGGIATVELDLTRLQLQQAVVQAFRATEA